MRFEDALVKLAKELDFIKLDNTTPSGGILFKGKELKMENFAVAPSMGRARLQELFLHVHEDYDAFKDAIINCYEEYSSNELSIEKLGGLNECFTMDYIRKHLFFVLVNTERNSALLANAPHRNLLGMSLMYRVDTSEIMPQNSSYVFSNTHMEKFSLTEEELYQIAYENTREMKEVQVLSLGDLVPGFPYEGPDLIWLLSNKDYSYGASLIMYEDILEEFCKEHLSEAWLVIPSSVHEVLLKPCSLEEVAEDFEMFEFMIKDVNSTLSESEVLSDKPMVFIPGEGLKLAEELLCGCI